MIEVIPLKYGTIFKHAFSQVDVFTQFVKDVLDIDINIDEVFTEYEYPEPIGFVKSKYDLFAEDKEKRIIVEIQQVKEDDFFDRFLYYHLISMVEQVGGYQEYAFDRTVYTIVLLTSTPRDGSVNFSCAVSDMNPIDENGKLVNVYPHRLVFLCPRLVNDNTPPKVKKWLEFIEDSLDKQMDETTYLHDGLLQKIIDRIQKRKLSPELLSEIKDDAAWDKAKNRFMKEAREQGLEEGLEQGREQGLTQGLEQGLTQGLEQGKKENMREVVKNMRAANIPIETIAQVTYLSIDEVHALLGELK